jgi:rSAM/selenodomain-associated transferase 1
MKRRHLIIFAKSPRLGRVKRRLAADIGAVEALRFYRHNLASTVRKLGYDPRWQCWLFVDRGLGRWPEAIRRRFQVRKDLGARMENALRTLPAGAVVLIGSDIPCVSPNDIWKAFTGLRKSGVIFGPAEDGGFWLVGLANRRTAPGLFRNVRWSTESTLADCIGNLDQIPLFVSTKSDVDNGSAFFRWRDEVSV